MAITDGQMFDHWKTQLNEHGELVLNDGDFEVFKVYARVNDINYEYYKEYSNQTVRIERRL